MASVVKRQNSAPMQSHPAKQPDLPLVQTNRERFQWENAVLRSTGILKDKAVPVAFYLSKAWREKLGYCFPTIEAIAADLGISQPTTWRSLQRLKRLGLIVIKKGKRRGSKHSHSIYYLTLQSGPLFQRNALKTQEIDMAELHTGHYSNQNSGEASKEAVCSAGAANHGNAPATSQNCIPATDQIRLDNQRIELQGAPPAPPTDSSQTDSVTDAREPDQPTPPDAGDAPEARADDAFRAALEPHQLTFYEMLDPADRYRYRKIDPDRREAFASAWDYQREVGDELDD